MMYDIRKLSKKKIILLKLSCLNLTDLPIIVHLFKIYMEMVPSLKDY